MARATVRFHGELRDLLDAADRGRPETSVAVHEGRSIKDAIQACGVPHTEVDLILAGGRPVGFDHPIADGEAIDVHGADRPPGLAALPGLAPDVPAPPRFVLDGHLGRLARYLRLLGLDVRYDRDASDDLLAQQSAGEDRILLTRDRGLLKRSIVRLGYLVREDDPRAQLGSVVRRFSLTPFVAPFTRCILCNGLIVRVPLDAVADELAGEPRTLRYFRDFGRCDGCGRVYWPGSHFDRMSRLIRDVVGPLEPSPTRASPASIG